MGHGSSPHAAVAAGDAIASQYDFRHVRSILWDYTISHNVHHRGQLSLLCRLAGRCAPGLYGPNREEMAPMLAAAK